MQAQDRLKAREAFSFSEEQEAKKTFINLGPWPNSNRRNWATDANGQKFFASFLQKKKNLSYFIDPNPEKPAADPPRDPSSRAPFRQAADLTDRSG